MTSTEKSQKRQENLKKIAESLGYKSWSTVQTDKNGVELFYDDIVKDLSGGLLIMEWDKELSMMYLRVVHNGVRVDFLKSYKLEKVGSKFENPELLEK